MAEVNTFLERLMESTKWRSTLLTNAHIFHCKGRHASSKGKSCRIQMVDSGLGCVPWIFTQTPIRTCYNCARAIYQKILNDRPPAQTGPSGPSPPTGNFPEKAPYERKRVTYSKPRRPQRVVDDDDDGDVVEFRKETSTKAPAQPGRPSGVATCGGNPQVATPSYLHQSCFVEENLAEDSYIPLNCEFNGQLFHLVVPKTRTWYISTTCYPI